MKLKIIGIVGLVLLFFNMAQSQKVEAKPFIEVTGFAEREVVPNEIYVNIIFEERMEGRVKISIEDQVEKLRRTLPTLGIDISNLYLSDATSDYVKVKWSKKDVLSTSEYTLMVSNADQLGKVFKEFDGLKIKNAYIARVDHSDIEDLKKEVKIKSIRNAKEKADYLLTSIGESTGQALVIKENHFSGIPSLGGNFETVLVTLPGVAFSDKQEEKLKVIQFKKIKIKSNIYAKFLIAN